ncbi:MAG: APC family permease [Actinobacteria bacterium]|nr:MAG: APC family permease [Actinomycetota bacterium]
MPNLKRFLLGNPLANEQAAHQRLSNPVALAVFSSDALSSVAYATEEILLMLVLAGTAALSLALPVAAGIGLLLVIVTVSYRQTIKAYPGGGGSYIVAKENLGVLPGLTAGASLLVDYILTVAVSISAGVAAITSAWPATAPYRIHMCLGFVVLLAIANLRGVRESGALFAGPTYLFVVTLGITIIAGLVKVATGGTIHVEPHAGEAVQGLTLYLVLRAFASGCTAMTGVEAIANGVQAFKQPEAVNARRTLTWMAGILLFLFVGTTLLAQVSGVTPSEGGATVVSQLAEGVFGRTVLYFVLQIATAVILVLAANTAYADFPRLASFMATDGFVPKQFSDRGYRLVFSNGIIVLSTVAAGLLVFFKGDTHLLIPLYAVGVFTGFTLSQAGMVVHWWKCREEGWHWSIAVNATGAVATGVVLAVIAITKFSHGAWLIVVVVPLMVAYSLWVKRRYAAAARRLALGPEERLKASWRSVNRMHNHVVLLVSAIDRRLIRAIQYVRSLSADDVEAVYVDVSGDKAAAFKEEWGRSEFGIRLTVLESPYREIIGPIERYIRAIERPTPDHVVTVVLPEFVPEDIADATLHTQTPLWIKTALYDEPGVIVVDVPYHIKFEAQGG